MGSRDDPARLGVPQTTHTDEICRVARDEFGWTELHPEQLRAIEAVMSLAPVCTEPRPTSGLVEQQRRFAKFRR